jgi:hypothetical protein
MVADVYEDCVKKPPLGLHQAYVLALPQQYAYFP